MIEPELKQELDKVNTNLITLTKKVGGTWSSLFKGLLSGFGSVIGVAIALVIIGWVLNALGYIPAFRQQASDWKQIIQKAQDATPLKQGK
jgi:Na+/melibiose symporter-like transporter